MIYYFLLLFLLVTNIFGAAGAGVDVLEVYISNPDGQLQEVPDFVQTPVGRYSLQIIDNFKGLACDPDLNSSAIKIVKAFKRLQDSEWPVDFVFIIEQLKIYMEELSVDRKRNAPILENLKIMVDQLEVLAGGKLLFDDCELPIDKSEIVERYKLSLEPVSSKEAARSRFKRSNSSRKLLII